MAMTRKWLEMLVIWNTYLLSEHDMRKCFNLDDITDIKVTALEAFFLLFYLSTAMERGVETSSIRWKLDFNFSVLRKYCNNGLKAHTHTHVCQLPYSLAFSTLFSMWILPRPMYAKQSKWIILFQRIRLLSIEFSAKCTRTHMMYPFANASMRTIFELSCINQYMYMKRGSCTQIVFLGGKIESFLGQHTPKEDLCMWRQSSPLNFCRHFKLCCFVAINFCAAFIPNRRNTFSIFLLNAKNSQVFGETAVCKWIFWKIYWLY